MEETFNLIDKYGLLNTDQKNTLYEKAALSFDLGRYKSLADILYRESVEVHICKGIPERSKKLSNDYLKEAQNYWMAKLQSKYDSERVKVKRAIGDIEKEREYIKKTKLRGRYIPENRIELYPEGYDKEHMNELLISTLAHEVMHAYFDRKGHSHYPYAYFVEEPLAEFGMLLYLQETRMPDILDWATTDVANKQSCYHYGAVLYDQYMNWNPFLRRYLEEYKYNINKYEMLDVESGESAIGLPYPVPSKLREIAIPHTSVGGRFCFDARSSWRSNGKSLYFTIPLAIANDLNFRASYKSKDRIHITFKDKSGGVYFIGDASIVSLDSTPRISVIGGSIGLYRDKLGVKDRTSYSFYEVSSNEWIAREL